jgi:hypothetical protein
MKKILIGFAFIGAMNIAANEAVITTLGDGEVLGSTGIFIEKIPSLDIGADSLKKISAHEVCKDKTLGALLKAKVLEVIYIFEAPDNKRAIIKIDTCD